MCHQKVQFKKYKCYVTRPDHKTPPTLVFSKRFVTKRQPTCTLSKSASLLNGSLPVKEFVFSKTVGLTLATLLDKDLLHKVLDHKC